MSAPVISFIDDPECEPRCDECGTHADETEWWCGVCGCCREHCANYVGCDMNEGMV